MRPHICQRASQIIRGLVTCNISLLALGRYSTAVKRVNGIVSAELEHQRRVQWTKCSYESMLLTADGNTVRQDLLPDGIHPSAPAWDALATACLDAPLAQLLTSI